MEVIVNAQTAIIIAIMVVNKSERALYVHSTSTFKLQQINQGTVHNVLKINSLIVSVQAVLVTLLSLTSWVYATAQSECTIQILETTKLETALFVATYLI